MVAKAVLTKAKADYDRTAFTQLLASGGFRFNSPEEAEDTRQRALARARKNNNPLELR